MARNILTVAQMQQLCDMVGPGFTVVLPNEETGVFPVVKFHELSWEVRSADQTLSLLEFRDKGPQRMWNEYHNKHGLLMCPQCGNYYRGGTGHICPINPPAAVRPEDVRGETHGDYTRMSQTIQEIKGAMRSGPQWGEMSAGQKEALELIATKLGRIVCGDRNCHDHWDDIAGYANLVSARIGHKPASAKVGEYEVTNRRQD